MMKTWHIHIEGRVQGVGFRPTVKRLADAMDLTGDVSNTPNGVHIHINCTIEKLKQFIDWLKEKISPAARITDLNYRAVADNSYDEFQILESENSSKVRLLVTPDLALCDDCREELTDKNDRRFTYAFTTCTNCGPRYSVLQHLPYDRERTTMNPFTMCPKCENEYNSTGNRRYYSQTNSCPECGIQLKWISDEPKNVDPILHAMSLLHAGKIVAVKGIGGFLLLVDATNKKAIKELRKRKNRPIKPLACLFRDISQAKRYLQINSKESELLTSAEAPIVLLQKKKNVNDLAYKCIAPKLNRIGAMLPYAPLLELIIQKVECPLIATSANVSGSPIVFRDEDAKRHLSGIADAILTNDREITFPQDDSVVALTSKYQKLVMMRRSRGYAPSFPIKENRLPEGMLGMGAEMKSAFGFTSNGLTFLSQFLGDTSKYESQESFEQTLNNLLDMMKPELKGVLIDAHPNYHTSQRGKRWAEKHHIPYKKIQHHKAHFAALLAEHDLLQSKEPVLGVVWDGTGFGDDGNIWGGEFFKYEENQMERIFHLGYFPVISGNRMALEPALSTYSIMHPHEPGKVWLRNNFSDQEQEILPQIAETSKLKTSSIGRLFDAVAGLLGFTDVNSFEGEAAMRLQVLAEKSKMKGWQPYCLALRKNTLNPQYLLESLHTDKKEKVPIADLALRFHQTLVQWIAFVADMNSINKIGLTGGVFQNTLLVDMIIARLSAYHDIYFHTLLPPNDENIAIGQIALAEFEDQFANREEQTKEDILCV